MWLVEYSDEASYYIDTNLPHIVGLMLALGRLMLTDDGLPIEGTIEPLGEERYRWTVAGHEVIFSLETSRTLIELIHLGGDTNYGQLFGPR